MTSERRRIASAATLILVAYGLSRVLGAVRELVIANTFGTRNQIDDYRVAFGVPDLLFNLLLAGAISSAFLPVLSEHLAKGEHERALEIAQRVLNSAVVILTVGAAVLFVVAPFYVSLIAFGYSPHDHDVIVGLTRILLLQPIFLGAGGMVIGILTAYQRFFAQALAPLFYNGAIIVAAAFFAPRYGVTALAIGVVGDRLDPPSHVLSAAPQHLCPGAGLGRPGAARRTDHRRALRARAVRARVRPPNRLRADLLQPGAGWPGGDRPPGPGVLRATGCHHAAADFVGRHRRQPRNQYCAGQSAGTGRPGAGNVDRGNPERHPAGTRAAGPAWRARGAADPPDDAPRGCRRRADGRHHGRRGRPNHPWFASGGPAPARRRSVGRPPRGPDLPGRRDAAAKRGSRPRSLGHPARPLACLTGERTDCSGVGAPAGKTREHQSDRATLQPHECGRR